MDGEMGEKEKSRGWEGILGDFIQSVSKASPKTAVSINPGSFYRSLAIKPVLIFGAKSSSNGAIPDRTNRKSGAYFLEGAFIGTLNN